MKNILLALELPDPVKQELYNLQDRITIPGLQWVAQHLLYAAVFFVEETTGEASDLATHDFKLPTPLRLRFSAVVSIYHRKKLTSLAASFVPTEPLLELARQTARLLHQPLAHEPVAHVALARMQGSRPACFREQDFPGISHLAFDATKIELYESPVRSGFDAHPLARPAAR